MSPFPDLRTLLTAQIAELESQIERLIAGDKTLAETARILRSVPGIGPVASTMLIAEMPELGQISGEEAAALTGLAPIAHDSGALGAKPLERRLYEIARKHCGAQSLWKVGIELLRDKCGSSSTPKEFRRLLGNIIEDDAEHDHMPDYVFIIEGDIVMVRPKKDVASLPFPPPLLRLDSETHEEARRVAPGWDIHHLEDEWRSWVLDKGIAVKDPDKHFISFCKRRGALMR